MIQGFYCLHFCSLVLHCLTDIKNWHYFMLSRDDHKHCMTIKWAYLFSGSIVKHAKFLRRAIKPIFHCEELIQLAAENAVENAANLEDSHVQERHVEEDRHVED